MTLEQRLKRIAEIIENVDHRCQAADGPVTATLEEMRQDEISEIYKLASLPVEQNVIQGRVDGRSVVAEQLLRQIEIKTMEQIEKGKEIYAGLKQLRSDV